MSIKRFVQVMFVYFGLLPDAAILAIGFILGYDGGPAAVLCAVFVIAERAIMRDLILLTRWAEKKWSARRGL